jgi:hypothetical protein
MNYYPAFDIWVILCKRLIYFDTDMVFHLGMSFEFRFFCSYVPPGVQTLEPMRADGVWGSKIFVIEKYIKL